MNLETIMLTAQQTGVLDAHTRPYSEQVQRFSIFTDRIVRLASYELDGVNVHELEQQNDELRRLCDAKQREIERLNAALDAQIDRARQAEAKLAQATGACGAPLLKCVKLEAA